MNVGTKRVSGIIEVTRSGKGFLIQEGEEKDVPILKDALGGALHGDVVEVEVKTGKHETLGRVLRVIERKRTTFVGEVVAGAPTPMLKPDDPRVYFPFMITEVGTATVGDKAVIDVTDWSAPPKAKVREVLGRAGEHETEMRAVLAARGFELGFPPAVLAEARGLYERRWSEEDLKDREDFRTTFTMTIDPEDAKDFDDAISLKELPDGNREVGVHIADVSFFVRPGSAIDAEALKRATSVYLVDRTVPMLPPELSEDLCSLMPNVDRLTFSAVFTIDTGNHVIARRFGRGIIKSAKRFTYEEADLALVDRALPYHKELAELWALASKLRKERVEAGAVMFDREEVKPVLNEKKEVVGFKRSAATPSHHLIEELMLLANREVAEYASKKLGKKSRLFVYRIHDLPKPEKIEELGMYLKALGYALPEGKKLQGKDLNALFMAIKGTPEERLIKTASVRAMAKAVYTTANIGHFGLAFDDYAQFTSPIRRYPDLMVHRTLATILKGERITEAPADIEIKAVHASERGEAAAEAERASVKLKQVEYFAKHIGETRKGVVSGVSEWGIYVEDTETMAEGMVRLMTLTDDSYIYDPKKYAVVGFKTKKVIALGDPVTYTVDGVDLEQRTIDFRLV